MGIVKPLSGHHLGHGAAKRSEGFVQAIKNSLRTNDFGQVMTVEIRLQVRLYVSKDETRALSGEVFLEFGHNPGSREVHVRDGSRINDQPMQWRRRGSGQHPCFLGKAI